MFWLCYRNCYPESSSLSQLCHFLQRALSWFIGSLSPSLDLGKVLSTHGNQVVSRRPERSGQTTMTVMAMAMACYHQRAPWQSRAKFSRIRHLGQGRGIRCVLGINACEKKKKGGEEAELTEEEIRQWCMPEKSWPTRQGALERVFFHPRPTLGQNGQAFNPPPHSQSPNAGCPRKGIILGKAAVCSWGRPEGADGWRLGAGPSSKGDLMVPQRPPR